jgi:signal transduction histidine kinase/CheY-like chemotaxis protein
MPVFDKKFDDRKVFLKFLAVLILFVFAFCAVSFYYSWTRQQNYARRLENTQEPLKKNLSANFQAKSNLKSHRAEMWNELFLQLVGFGFLVSGATLIFVSLNRSVLRINHFLCNVIDSLVHPFYVIDAQNYSVIMANKAASRDGELTNNPCRKKELSSLVEQVHKTSMPSTAEYVDTDDRGRQKTMKIHAYPLYENHETPTHVLGYTLDITHWKKAEEELRRRRENMQAICEAAPVGMMLVDETLRIRQINRVAAGLTGNTMEQMLNCRIGDSLNCLHSMDSPEGCGSGNGCAHCRFTQILGKVFKEGCTVEKEDVEETYMISGQESRLSFEVSAVPIQLEGKQYAILILNNITDRKLSEEELRIAKEQTEGVVHEMERLNSQLDAAVQQANRLAQEAISANKAKSEFLATLSHEIRTPMNSILGFGDLLDEEPLSESQKEYVQLIRNSGNTLLSLINDILDFSKIEAGKLTVEKVETPLNVLLEEIESIFRPMAAKKGLELAILQCEDIPQTIQTDPTRLRQCLINLVNNAIKFTDQGYVYVNVSRRQKQEKTWIQFDIEDTGVGIPADKQQSIFDAFVQAENSTTRKYGGTGLGLAITKKLAELLGGDLSIVSQFGEGSVFTLTIDAGAAGQKQNPWSKYDLAEAIQKPSKPDKPCDPKNKFKVLLVEDNPVNQQLMKVLLEKMGHIVTLSENGQQAVETMEKTKDSFDIILMDIQMPVMNGLEATRSLRQKNFKTPIVAVTANAMKGDREQCLEAGCDDYLSKPVDKDDLKDIILKYASPVSV